MACRDSIFKRNAVSNFQLEIVQYDSFVENSVKNGDFGEIAFTYLYASVKTREIWDMYRNNER